MRRSTHVKMAKLLAEVLDIPNIPEFIKGMKLPDSGLNRFKVRHTKENTLYQVRLLLELNSSRWLQSEMFSHNLGVILHYTMDYFAKYHENDHMFDKTTRHTLYELYTHHVWNRGFEKKAREYLAGIGHVVGEDIIASFDTVDFLETKIREKYLSPSTPRRDLEYAFNTSFIIGTVLTKRWQDRKHIMG